MCVNTLSQLTTDLTGLPVSFIIRSILEKSSIAQAETFVRGVKHASGENYMIADGERVMALEASGNSVASCEPSDVGFGDKNCVIHTNHPFVNTDQISYYEDVSKLPADIRNHYVDRLANSKDRLKALRSHIQLTKKLGLEAVKRGLRLHEGPVCVHKKQEMGKPFTFGSTVMVQSDPPVLHLMFGPPCSTVYNQISF